ncbi:MAG: sugar transferase [Bacteroidales bacterium]|nr:sugar transferase [Bacteroidales bacterium]
MKRMFDIIVSFSALIILIPVFIIISIWILLDSRGRIFYTQKRVGRGNRDFIMFKFRSMHSGAETKGLLTVGSRDPRVSKAGYWLRKAKLDELPQLLNILRGDMSFVGPRPEVRKYVDLYDDKQLKVLDVRPGLTDYASLKYIDENRMLEESREPEKTYVETIMPAKLKLNLHYIHDQSLLLDIRIIFKTIAGILRARH